MAVSSAVSGRSVSGSDGSRRSMIPSARGPGRATTSESPPSVKSMPLGANGIGSVVVMVIEVIEKTAIRAWFDCIRYTTPRR